MKLNKQLSLLLCGALMVSALAGCGGGKDQQGVDDQQAHPSHGQSDHYSHRHGKQRILPEDIDAPAASQGRMDGGEHQFVVEKAPQ